MGLCESEEASRLLREAIEELENPKGRVAAAIRKIQRAASLVKNSGLVRWCRIQLGDESLTKPIQDFKDAIVAAQGGTKEDAKVHQRAYENLLMAGVRFGEDFTLEEFNVKLNKAGGGWQNIEVTEEIHDRFIREKRGNDGIFYVYELAKTITYVRREAHSRAVALYHKLEFATSASTAFDIMKEAVDDKLVSLAPELGEKLMLAFEHVSAGREKERWSQALTSCRRLLEELANRLYPPREEIMNGRKLGKAEYINRLWAFMDEKIASEKNREVAKAHVDLVGGYLESTLGVTHKGVHSEVSRLEAVRAVLHTYLVVADILSYLDRSTMAGGPLLPNIHSVGRDEIITLASVKAEVANAIIKLRATKGQIRSADLLKIKGIGPKTLERIQKNFSLDYPPPSA